MSRKKKERRVKVSEVLADRNLLLEEISKGRLGRTMSLLRGAINQTEEADFQAHRIEPTMPPLENSKRLIRYLTEEAISEMIRRRLRVDHREYWIMLEYMGDAGFEIVHLNTGEGDYASERVNIERKDGDWWSSLFGDGRIMKQLSTMRETNSFSFLIVSRSWTQLKRELSAKGVSPEVMVGFVASLSVAGYPPIFVDDNHDNARLIEKIISKVEDDSPRVWVERPKKATPAEWRDAILGSLPGVGVVMRRKLLEKFPSIIALAAATVDELTEVDGVGVKTAQRISDILNAGE